MVCLVIACFRCRVGSWHGRSTSGVPRILDGRVCIQMVSRSEEVGKDFGAGSIRPQFVT